jgi:S1-C subfamily serine protease
MATLRILTVVALVMASAPARAESLPDLAARAKPSVVLINVVDASGGKGSGTGFFVAPRRVITNHHVIEGARKVTATLSDGAEAKVGGLLADDAAADLAVLAVAADVPPLLLGDSAGVRAGDEIAIIGSPLGLAGTLSTGIVSALREKGVAEDRADFGRSWGIQVTAAISPGSSGSPIMNRNGEVIAVAVGQVRGAQNLNFGVPVESAKALLAPLDPNAPAAPFESQGRAESLRNLAISAAVVGVPAFMYLAWSAWSRRRGRGRRVRTLH